MDTVALVGTTCPRLGPHYGCQHLLDRLAEVEAETTCETHNHALVWCNECCRIDREAWQARLETAERERDAYKADRDAHQRDAINRGLRAQALAAALEKYGRHLGASCYVLVAHDANTVTCICGFDAALAAARGEG